MLEDFVDDRNRNRVSSPPALSDEGSARADAPASWLWGRWCGAGLIAALVTLTADQAHKFWTLYVYDLPAKGRVALTPFLDMVFVVNKGISYSLINQDSFGGQIALCVFALIAAAAMWVWMARSSTGRLMAVSLGLIIGGALGNAIDRVRIGGVADFFSLHAYGFYWYIFNIADVAIVAGVVGLLYDSFKSSRIDAVKPR